MQRRKWLGNVMGMGLVLTAALAGCSSEPLSNGEEQGTLRVPLTTQANSGTQYRLRDAQFEISGGYYYYDEDVASGGASGSSFRTVVSSEDDPDARSIDVSVERGYYYVRLLPGWRMEKVVNGAASPVEAQLLSNATAWVYVSPRTSQNVTYQFGIGGRAIWFNGDLNIDIQVYEDPSELYGGSAGAGGLAGAGGDAG